MVQARLGTARLYELGSARLGLDAMGGIPPPIRGVGTKPMQKWGPAEA